MDGATAAHMDVFMAVLTASTHPLNRHAKTTETSMFREVLHPPTHIGIVRLPLSQCPVERAPHGVISRPGRGDESFEEFLKFLS